MDLEQLTAYCLAKPGAVDEHPFGPGALVIKVGGRIFAIIAEDDEPVTVSLKCEPEVAIALRELHRAVVPGYHLNKRHWNTVTFDGSIATDDVASWIDDSYDLVVDQLPKHVQKALGWTRPELG